MGGSAKYRTAKKANQQQPKPKTFRDKINDAQTQSELLTVLRDEYGKKRVKADFVLKNDVGMVKRAMNTIQDLEEKYPFMKGYVNFFYESPHGIASMNTGGGLSLNSKFWDKDDKRMYSGKNRGWWPPNYKPESLIAHEFGHAITFKYYRQLMAEAKANNDLNTQMTLVAGAQSGQWLRDVEKEAMKSLGIKTKKAAYTRISGYASFAQTTKKQGFVGILEAFAEAFGDVHANGDNASPVSKAYVNTLISKIK